MPTMRKTLSSPEPNANPTQEPIGARSISRYEQCREERIKENLQRMQSLGIFDLSLKLKPQSPPAKKPFRNPSSARKSTRDGSPLQLSRPIRRSPRLQNVTPVSHSDTVEAKRGKALEDTIFQLEDGSRPEIYTKEHETLLKNAERSLTCLVDGYRKDVNRIYDPVNGKTCHQCRQKTLGHRTQCCQCNMLQGQFCGDCLLTRYGEQILEALENQDWICPVCRGICNCSLCRTRKGLSPTGAIYKKISKLGYKSVAHYLIHTEGSLKKSEKQTDVTPSQTSAKRSLSFQEVEASSLEHSNPNTAPGDLPEILKLHQDMGNQNDDDHHVDVITGEKSLQENGNNGIMLRSLSFLPSGDEQASALDVEVQCDLMPSENLSPEEVQKGQNPAEEEKRGSSGASESCSKRAWNRKVYLEPSPDSVAGRLKQRRRSQSGLAIEEIA